MIYLDLTSIIAGGIIGIVAMMFWNWFYKRHNKFDNLKKELKEAHYCLKKANSTIIRLYNVLKDA